MPFEMPEMPPLEELLPRIMKDMESYLRENLGKVEGMNDD